MCFSIEAMYDPWFQALLLSIYLIGYYGLHSLLAGRRILGRAQQVSRVIFNLIAIIGLVPLVAFLCYWHIPLWNGSFIALQLMAIFFILLGSLIVWRSFQSFNASAFFGVQPENKADNALLTKGLYKSTRHPMYFGSLLVLIGLFLWRQDLLILVFCIISVAYLYIGSRNEERKLIREFPDKYPEYRSSTPAIIPADWIGFFMQVFKNID